jgi:hypothetical protein
MRTVTCQGRTFVTTNDVADALRNFYEAAQRRGRVVRIDVPIVTDSATGENLLSLVLIPGDQLHVAPSDEPDVDLDTAPLVESLTRRKMAWISRRIDEHHDPEGPA